LLLSREEETCARNIPERKKGGGRFFPPSEGGKGNILMIPFTTPLRKKDWPSSGREKRGKRRSFNPAQGEVSKIGIKAIYDKE